jgi:hypothetical protein
VSYITTIRKEDVSTAAVRDAPTLDFVRMLLEGCEEEVATTYGSSYVTVADRDKGGEGGEVRAFDDSGSVEEEAEEGCWVDLTKAMTKARRGGYHAAARRGGYHAAPCSAGEGGAYECCEGGKAKEDVE